MSEKEADFVKKLTCAVLVMSALIFSCSCAADTGAAQLPDGVESAVSTPPQFISDTDISSDHGDASQKTSPSEDPRDNSDNYSSQQESGSALTSDDSSVPQQSTPKTPPSGTSRASGGRFRFTSSVLSLSVVFPDEFDTINTDYTPAYGIYLKNRSGDATLMIESVEDRTMTHKEMAQYLRSTYPKALVTATDKKEIVCKLLTEDKGGNPVYVMEKIKLKNGGYNSASLCCRPDDKSAYLPLFNEIEFT